MFSEVILQSFLAPPKATEPCNPPEGQSSPPNCPRREAVPKTAEEAIARLNEIYQQLLVVQKAGFLERGSQVDEALADALTAVLNASDSIGDTDRTQV